MAFTSPSSSACWDSVDQALERGDASGAAATAQNGLRAVAYDERKSFFTQLCAVLLRRARTVSGAKCVAEVGELLWSMPEFRSATSATASLSGETLLLAAVVATAYTTMQNYAKALVFDRELLQSPALFTYDGFTVVDRLACVARTLTASRLTDDTRYVDSAVHKGMSLYHSLAKLPSSFSLSSRTRFDDAAAQQRNAVVCAYLLELGCYRQKQNDYLRAFQAFFELHENIRQAEALCRAACSALCIRASEEVRQTALHDVLHCNDVITLPSLYLAVQRAYKRELFCAVDVAAALEAAGDYVPKTVLRDALREHNIVLLAKTFDNVHWRSLCLHMDDADLTETQLYDLLVEMGRGQRLEVAIHQDTGFIEFGSGGKELRSRQDVVSDVEVFKRIARAASIAAAACPDTAS
jgi:hypothetical protein